MRYVLPQCLCGKACWTSHSWGDECSSLAAGIHDIVFVEGTIYESLSHKYCRAQLGPSCQFVMDDVSKRLNLKIINSHDFVSKRIMVTVRKTSPHVSKKNHDCFSCGNLLRIY